MSNQYQKQLKVLSVGNSFAVDTMEYLPSIAKDLNVKDFYFANLYIGGCSTNRHFQNAENDAPAYDYYTNSGDGWQKTAGVRISDAIRQEEWDWISIQHGTGDGSRYTCERSYEKLGLLVAYIREKASPKTKIAFNMAWVMEADGTHPEIRSYNGDQLQMYQELTRITERVVMPTRGLDVISPTGTAIQNARTTALFDRLSRDGFHLSYDVGRYIAALTFFKALTGMEIDGVLWKPDGVGEDERLIAIRAAVSAVKAPFSITDLSV